MKLQEFEYPAPKIDWHPGAQGLVNENRGGIQCPQAFVAAKPVGSSGTLKVKVDTAVDLSDPGSGGAHRYCVSAFYYNEGPEVKERRRTAPQAAKSSSSRVGIEDCVFQEQIRIPYNSRQQFVQVAVYIVDAQGSTYVMGHGLDGNPHGNLVGEAHVPIADPRSEQLTSWPLMRGGAVGEHTGNITIELCLPGPEDAEEEAAVAAAASIPLPAAVRVAAAVAQPVAEAPPGPLPPPSALPPLSAGDAVEIFSSSAGKWQLGTVTKINGADITVEYCARQRLVQLTDPKFHDYFRWVEDQAGAAAKLQAADPRSGTGSAGSPQTRRIYSVGEAIEVLSSSQGRWVQGSVTAISEDESTITIYYGDRMRQVNLLTEDYTAFLRPAELPSPPPAPGQTSVSSAQPAGSSYKVGNPVEIFSQSAGQWMQGVIIKVDGELLTVEYAGRQKPIDLKAANLAEFFRSLVDPAGAGYDSASQLPVFPGLGGVPSAAPGGPPLPTSTAQFGQSAASSAAPQIDWGIKPLVMPGQGAGFSPGFSAIQAQGTPGFAGLQQMQPAGLAGAQLQRTPGLAGAAQLQRPPAFGMQGQAPQRLPASSQPQAPGGFQFR